MPKSLSRKPGKPTRSKLTRQIITTVKAYEACASVYEQVHLERMLDHDLLQLLDKKKEREIEQIMEELTQTDPESAATIFERLQYLSEFCRVTKADTGESMDCLLLTMPILVWTRYGLPVVSLSEQTKKYLDDGLKQFVLAPDVEVLSLPRFLSPLEMPMAFSETRQWLLAMAQSAINGIAHKVSPNPYPDGLSLLADSRHLITVATTRQGYPVFRWLSDPALTRQQCLVAWREHAHATLAELFPGCQIEIVLPDSFFESDWAAREGLRPIGVKASVDWLHAALNLPLGQLRANVMRFGDEVAHEFRIGYSRKGDTDVLFGTIWPKSSVNINDAYDSEESLELEQVIGALKAAGIHDIRTLSGIAPMEYCSDCGAAMFPNQDGELVHAEMPDEAFDMPQHFH